MSRDDELTTQQAAQIADVDVKTIRNWFHDGKIEGHKLPGGLRMPFVFSNKSLLSYLALKKSAIKSPKT